MKIKFILLAFLYVSSTQCYCQSSDTILFNENNWEWFIEPKYEYAGIFIDGFINAIYNKQRIRISKSGIEFSDFHIFYRDTMSCAKTIDNKLYGYIDKKGNWVIEPQFQNARSFSDKKYARAKFNDKWGFIDRTGDWKITPQYDTVLWFLKDIAPVQQNNLWGFIDENNDFIIPCQFDSINSAFGKNVYVKQNNSWALIDYEGNYISKDIRKKWFLTDSLLGIQENGKYGIKTIANNWIAEPVFDELDEHFYGGLLKVKHNGKYGYINKYGKIVIEPQYEYTRNFFMPFSQTSTLEYEKIHKIIDNETAFFYGLTQDYNKLIDAGKLFWIDRMNKKYSAVKYLTISHSYAVKTI